MHRYGKYLSLPQQDKQDKAGCVARAATVLLDAALSSEATRLRQALTRLGGRPLVLSLRSKKLREERCNSYVDSGLTRANERVRRPKPGSSERTW